MTADKVHFFLSKRVSARNTIGIDSRDTTEHAASKSMSTLPLDNAIGAMPSGAG